MWKRWEKQRLYLPGGGGDKEIGALSDSGNMPANKHQRLLLVHQAGCWDFVWPFTVRLKAVRQYTLEAWNESG